MQCKHVETKEITKYSVCYFSTLEKKCELIFQHFKEITFQSESIRLVKLNTNKPAIETNSIL